LNRPSLSQLFATAKQRAGGLRDRAERLREAGGLSALMRQMEEMIREEERRIASGRHPLHAGYAGTVSLWYARLELRPGADSAELRRQYRSLMRQYHPDKFAAHPGGERLATRVAQELTVAYEGLLEHLGEN
jgi:DnaJ-domain-containing protein 1